MRKSFCLIFTCSIYITTVAGSCSEDETSNSTSGDPTSAGSLSPVIGTSGTNGTNSVSGNGGASAQTATGGSQSEAGAGGTAARAGNTTAGIGGITNTTPTGGTTAGIGGAGATGGAGGSQSTAGDGVKEVTECSIPEPSASGNARAVLVDASQVSGTIHSLQGAHWDPGPANSTVSRLYVEMGVDMIRTHDAGGINGSGVGDIDGAGRDRIFPNMNADSNQESSYNFRPTDTLIKNIQDAGAEVFFRVGRSNLMGAGTAAVPPDFDKYADIVKHVVMHYNKGWANGYEYGIRYFEIWNEPDFSPFWSGTGEQYHELYGKIARAIQEADSEALIGGPANASFNDYRGTRGSFMKYIVDNQLPIDFFSYHKYTNKTNDPYEYKRMAEELRTELDTYGLTETTIINSEWWTSLEGDIVLGGVAGQAAFLAQALIYQQPLLEKSFNYAMFRTPSKLSLAFGAVTKMNETPRLLCHKTQAGEDNGFAVMAGSSSSEQRLQVVIASYHISPTLMGPSVDEQNIVVTIMSYLPRRTIIYPDTEGYELTIKGVPESWGDVTVEQYRIDATNDNTLLNTQAISAGERSGGSFTVSGTSWVGASSFGDPLGAPQGVDLIVVTGAGTN